MAAVVTAGIPYKSGGGRREVRGTIAFDNSYPTGGESVTVHALGLSILESLTLSPNKGYVFEWDGTTASPKILAYHGDNNNASDGPLIEVPNTTDLSTCTAVRYIARGY